MLVSLGLLLGPCRAPRPGVQTVIDRILYARAFYLYGISEILDVRGGPVPDLFQHGCVGAGGNYKRPTVHHRPVWLLQVGKGKTLAKPSGYVQVYVVDLGSVHELPDMGGHNARPPFLNSFELLQPSV